MRDAFRLRTISRAEADLEQCVAALKQAGISAELHRLPVPSGYVAFEVTHSGVVYEGWTDAVALLRRMYPEVSELAWRLVDAASLLESMIEENVLDALPAPQGGWDKARPVAILSDPVEQRLLVGINGAAHAWFLDFPRPRLPAPGLDDPYMQALVTVSCRIGWSTMPFALWSGIASGDALLIQHPDWVATVGGKPLCRFQYEGEQIMLEHQFENDALDGHDLAHLSQDSDVSQYDDSFKIHDIPVQIEFVLHDTTMRFADLSQLYPGSVLNMNDDAAANVRIRANGRLLATGQLIQVGEQLAVQVKSVNFSSK